MEVEVFDTPPLGCDVRVMRGTWRRNQENGIFGSVFVGYGVITRLTRRNSSLLGTNQEEHKNNDQQEEPIKLFNFCFLTLLDSFRLPSQL
jgi:hypothetical protein